MFAMTRFAALLCCAVGLCAALFWELTDPEQGRDAAPAVVALKSPVIEAGRPAGVDMGVLDHAADTITRRPLFSASRRSSATGMSASADASGSAGLPRLTGVIVGPLGGLAIFASNDGKPHTVAEGDKIGNFTVRTIGSETVRLIGPEGDRVVRPAFITSRAGKPGEAATR
jgi:hypothetical protein